MTFIKANKRRGYSYYSVVETVREDGEPRHNDLLYLGRLDNLTPEERRTFEVDLCEIDPSLLPDFYELLVEHDYDFETDTDSVDHIDTVPTSSSRR